MSEETSTSAGASGDSDTEKADKDDKKSSEDHSRFECNICLEIAKDAVVSMCGHLFCWPCLHQWLLTRPNQQLCPVCKSAVNRDKVIPLYGRSGNDSDPRDKVPPRPRGVRSEETQHPFSNFHFGGDHGGGVQFSLGIGVFPISFIASFFNASLNGERRPEPPNNGSQQYNEERMLSNIFLAMGTCFLLWLFFT